MTEELIPKVRAKIKYLSCTSTYICSSQYPEISIPFQKIWGTRLFGTIVQWRQTAQKDKKHALFDMSADQQLLYIFENGRREIVYN